MKISKNVLLIGNDWLSHVVLGAFFTWKFGWWGLIPSFFSHFIIDMIPHGHLEGVEQGVKIIFFETLKGNLAGLVLCIYFWFRVNFAQAFLIGSGIYFSILPDIILETANFIDKKKIWKKFFGWKRKIIFYYSYLNIQLNYFFHWFGRPIKLTFFLKLGNLWKEKNIHNCGLTGKGIKLSWWNIVQPIVITFFIFLL